jgi:hypothetical protein
MGLEKRTPRKKGSPHAREQPDAGLDTPFDVASDYNRQDMPSLRSGIGVDSAACQS